jgi:type IV secretion system protein VirB11
MEPLQRWLGDREVQDIAIQNPRECWVYRRGAWERHEVDLGYDELEDIAVLAGALRRQDVGEDFPLLSAELPGGERLQACLPATVPNGTVSITIRKPTFDVIPLGTGKVRYRSDGWNQYKRGRSGRDMKGLLEIFDSGDLEEFLAAAVRARLTILLTGATGSGKTFWSKRCAAAIDPGERIITIEDVPELTIIQKNHVCLLFRRDDKDAAAVGPEDLLQASLRMRPNRVLVAELRGPEAYVYASEVMTGHPGSISTCHGNDASTAFRRLFMLCKSSAAGAALADETLLGMLADTVDVIMPLMEDSTIDEGFRIGPTWFAADAARRGETAADLLRAAP